MLRRLRFERPMSSPVAMPHGKTLVLMKPPSARRSSRRIAGTCAPVVLRLRSVRRLQPLEDEEREAGEEPLDQHVDRGDEEREAEVVVILGEHPLVCEGDRLARAMSQRARGSERAVD